MFEGEVVESYFSKDDDEMEDLLDSKQNQKTFASLFICLEKL